MLSEMLLSNVFKQAGRPGVTLLLKVLSAAGYDENRYEDSDTALAVSLRNLYLLGAASVYVISVYRDNKGDQFLWLDVWKTYQDWYPIVHILRNRCGMPAYQAFLHGAHNSALAMFIKAIR